VLPNWLSAPLAERGFEVVGVSWDGRLEDDPADFLAWCAEHGVTWPQVWGGEDLNEPWAISSIPFSVLVDAEGRVAAAGGELRCPGCLEERVRELLSAEAPPPGSDDGS
jgi:hypothetical protein